MLESVLPRLSLPCLLVYVVDMIHSGIKGISAPLGLEGVRYSRKDAN